MSSIRRLKKDVDLLVFEVISDCFAYGKIHPGDKDEKVTGIISDAVNLRNNLIGRINAPVKAGAPKEKRSYYNSIVRDLFVGVDGLCGRLSDLTVK